jgi:WXXGXW repeat (2 copies)
MSTLFRLRNLMLLLVLCAVPFAMPTRSYGQIGVGIAIHIGPPALPVYTQPPCPQDGFLWTPGYWAYGPAGYYWVP